MIEEDEQEDKWDRERKRLQWLYELKREGKLPIELEIEYETLIRRSPLYLGPREESYRGGRSLGLDDHSPLKHARIGAGRVSRLIVGHRRSGPGGYHLRSNRRYA